MKPYRKRIAPRLASGDKRDRMAHGLPPHIKRGLAMRAYRERTSVSWLLERLIIDAGKFDQPDYLERKTHLRIAAKKGA